MRFSFKLKGEDIALKSKGEQICSYCYVMDAISDLLIVLISVPLKSERAVVTC